MEFFNKAIPEEEKGKIIKEYPYMSKKAFNQYCEEYVKDISIQFEDYRNKRANDWSGRIFVYTGLGYLFIDSYQLARLGLAMKETCDTHELLWRIENELLPFHIAKTIFTDEKRNKLKGFVKSGYAMRFPSMLSEDAHKAFYLHFNKRKEFEGNFKGAVENAVNELKIKWERKGLNKILDVEDLDENYYAKSQYKDKEYWLEVYEKAKENGLGADLLDLAFEMRFINAFRNASYYED